MKVSLVFLFALVAAASCLPHFVIDRLEDLDRMDDFVHLDELAGVFAESTQDPTTDMTTLEPTTVVTTPAPTTVVTTPAPTTTKPPTTTPGEPMTTDPPLEITRQPQVVAIYRVDTRNVNGLVTTTATQVCSGTIVSSQAVLTTATCAMSANSTSGLAIRILTNKYEATNEADIPITDYYQVLKVEVHPEYDAAKNLRNLAILKMDMDIEYIDNEVSVVGWVENPATLSTQCIASFWSTTTPFKQVNMNARIVACPDATNTLLICADITVPSTRMCMGGEDGTSLICNGRIAGMLSATTSAACDVTKAKPFNELSSDKPFLWNTVNAAPMVHFSATAFLAMLVVMVKNYC